MSENISAVIPCDGTWFVKINGECEPVIAWFIDKDEGMCPRPLVHYFGVLPIEDDLLLHTHEDTCVVVEEKEMREYAEYLRARESSTTPRRKATWKDAVQ